LNERRGSLGLNETDFFAAGVFFCVVSFVLSGTPYMLVAFPLTLIPLLLLWPIRLKYRRKIVRDYLAYKFFPRRVYAPKV
jgi:heme exporter protein D